MELTRKQVTKKIKRLLKEKFNNCQRSLAQKIGKSDTTINFVLKERLDPPEELLKLIGVKRKRDVIVTYEGDL